MKYTVTRRNDSSSAMRVDQVEAYSTSVLNGVLIFSDSRSQIVKAYSRDSWIRMELG